METYTVKITGEISEYQQRDEAISEFAKLFSITIEQAEKMFKNAPVAIKKGIELDVADKFKEALIAIGVECIAISSARIEALDRTENKTINSSVTKVEVEARSITEATFGEEMIEEEIIDEIRSEESNFKGLTFTIDGDPDYGFATIQIPANEMLKVEASAMATMDVNLKMKTKFKGGLGRLVTGESIFINEFTAEGGPAEIGIAPGAPGDLSHQYLDNQTIFLQNSAFVACTQNVNVETKWQGLTKGFFSGESLFLIRCSGVGDLWFNTYGAIIEIDVTKDYVVDTGNIVGFTEGLDYKITKVGGYKSLFFSGEGFVCRFSGNGKVWIQTRGVDALVGWAHWFRPVKRRNN
ncbi:MAG: TIGR00266 family protein [Moraxellaceae bacterium]|nr:MAG: TIGR00266 family protein [Moraxellaceae bacterium]